MKISGSTVALASSHFYQRRETTRSSLEILAAPHQDIPRPAPSMQPTIGSASPASAELQAIKDGTDAVEGDPMLILLKTMVEFFLGHRVQVFSQADMGPPPTSTPVPASPTSPPSPAGSIAPPQPEPGIAFDFHAEQEEIEQTAFAAQGVIQTSDGQTINFQLELTMSRHYLEQVDFSLRAGSARRTDPLVLNFSGTGAQLSDQHFSFDLNSDGQAENVALLAPGSAYLALDRNGNGRIDSGQELFGPASGSGFGELAGYDSDGNGWIDENDPVFRQLRLWTPAGEGSGSVQHLGDQAVGALYLGKVASPFALRSSSNQDLGAIAESGLFLKENGVASLMQEIDLTA